MDIHRCRFVPYPPQAISALALSHVSDPSQKAPAELRLALGRENGDVEIWNPLGGRWVQESVLRSSTGRSVDRLAWIQDFDIDEEGNDTIAKPGRLRLFSTDSSKALSEWDIAKGTIKRQAETNFGDLWCIAAQPSYQLPRDGKIDQTPPSQLVVGGCGDGSIVLFSTEDDDLRFLRLLTPAHNKKAKVLSITWRDRNTVVSGYDDQMIKIIDVNDRKVIRNMALGKNPEGGKSIVWALKCLPDGTILSGDSFGELKIWDSKNFSCIQRLKTHQADIQDIVTNAKGDLVFTVAVDRRTTAYKPIVQGQGKKTQRWTRLMHRRYHDHDIKCAAAYEAQGLSFLVSGGVDATPISVPMQNWQTEYHRSLSHLPQQPQVSIASKQRLMMSWWGRDIHIFHIPRRNQDGNAAIEADLNVRHDYEQLAMLRLNGEENIRSAQISKDGRFIIAATASSTRLFQLRLTKMDGKLSLRSRPIELPSSSRTHGARHSGFSPDGRWLLAIRLDNTIVLTKIMRSENPKEKPTLHDKVVMLSPHHTKATTALSDYTSNISTFTFSPDSRVLATGDISGTINAWILEGHEDLTYSPADSDSSESESDSDSESESDDEDESPIVHGQRWTRTAQGMHFPRLDSMILTLTFRPASNPVPSSPEVRAHPTRHHPHALAPSSPATTNLLAITAMHAITEFDVATGKLTDWSRRNPSSLLPEKFTRLRDRAMGCFWDTPSKITGQGRRERLWLYGVSWMYMLDLAHDLTQTRKHGGLNGNVDGGEEGTGKKRKRGSFSKRKQGQDAGTGAGNAIKAKDRGIVGYGSLGVKYAGPHDEMEVVNLDIKLEANDEGSGEVNTALLNLRRGNDGEDTEMQDVDATDTANREGGAEQQHQGQDEAGSKAVQILHAEKVTKYWGTFHYRSIFGVGVLSSASEGDTDDAQIAELGNRDEHILVDGIDASKPTRPNLEIVVIERPMHDVDLPPRFDGGQDWDA
jgi:U3 small nucleolar RNA-associated protein 4